MCVYNMEGVYDSARLRLEVSLMYVHNTECMCNIARVRLQVSVMCVHYRGYVCKRVNVLQEIQCAKHRQISSLMTRTKTFLETSVYSPFSHLTRPLAQKYFIKFSCQRASNCISPCCCT